MTVKTKFRLIRGQTREEVLLVILVCAIALIATLSVFIPGLRHLWVALGRIFIK